MKKNREIHNMEPDWTWKTPGFGQIMPVTISGRCGINTWNNENENDFKRRWMSHDIIQIHTNILWNIPHTQPEWWNIPSNVGSPIGHCYGCEMFCSKEGFDLWD